jgi:hypothetical protein
MPSRIDDPTLQMALIGYQAELSRIEQKMADIRSLLGGRVNTSVAQKVTPKRVLGVAARARIAAGQKKRWAAFHKGKKVAAVAELPKAKRRISEEGLNRIIAATKKRWAAKRAAARAAAKAAAEKAAVKTAPAEAGKKAAGQKAARRKSATAKAAQAPVKKAAKKSSSVTPQPTGAAGSVPAPEVAAQ